jgi:DNA-binding FadR family transcriptional regulator
VQENAIVKECISKQIAEQLRAAIIDGRFKIGERLSTEDELARNAIALQASMNELFDHQESVGLLA